MNALLNHPVTEGLPQLVENELLVTFFTRHNPTNDPIIRRGWGPSRLRVDGRRDRVTDDRWNLTSSDSDQYKNNPPMPNPDTVIGSVVIPVAEDVRAMSKLFGEMANGKDWLEACNVYATSLGGNSPTNMSFHTNPTQLARSLYLFMGSTGVNGADYDWTRESQPLITIPDTAVHGEFRPRMNLEHAEHNGNGRVVMYRNAGALDSHNDRLAYDVRRNRERDVTRDGRRHQVVGNIGEITCFDEFVLGYTVEGFCKHPQPGIRVELNPADPNQSTMAREQQRSLERISHWKRPVEAGNDYHLKAQGWAFRGDYIGLR